MSVFRTFKPLFLFLVLAAVPALAQGVVVRNQSELADAVGSAVSLIEVDG